MTEADNNAFKPLTKKFDHLQELNPNAVQEEVSTESFIGLDCDIATTCLSGIDAKIVAQIFDPNFENNDDEAKDNVNKSIH